MKTEFTEGPFSDDNRELSSMQNEAINEEIKRAFQPPPEPPFAALNLLFQAAVRDTGGSQAARSFLFWLRGLDDPTGYRAQGGIELRRLDRTHKSAAIEVLT